MGGSHRVVLVCPGRGAYTSASLGSLAAEHPLVMRAEELRAPYGLEPLADLDGAGTFEPPRHLRPSNAAPLIFLSTLLDVETAVGDHDPVAVVGNSLGWYSALAVSGALGFDDAFRLVQQMALLQEEPLPEDGPGGQVIYPLTDADWQPDAERQAAVAEVLSNGAAPHVFESVELGAYAVLAGDEGGVQRLLRGLPPVQAGDRRFPLRLALHGPYHTPLLARVAEAAAQALAGLDWERPTVTLVDGRGAQWSPWSTDTRALAAYTLGEQVTTPYRFATSVRVALREHAPDLLVLPGPGNSLGGICAQIVVREGYRGITTRAAFEEVQASAAPVLLSMRR